MKRFFSPTLFLIFLAAFSPSHAATVFTNLGTGAPPATISTYTMQPFDQVPQAAIPDSTSVTTIPGSPLPGTLTTTSQVIKLTVPSSWATWSHGYTGVVYFSQNASVTMNLPANTGAFYFYAQPDQFAVYNFTVVTNSGATSGTIGVDGNAGANGFAFHTTAGESITSITVTADSAAGGFAVGEFGIAASVIQRTDQTITFGAAPTPTYAPSGTFQVTATATSSLPVTFSSQTPSVCTTSSTSSPATVNILTAGLCTIAADQAGDSNYNAAPQVTQNITIDKATTTTTITGDTPDPSIVNQLVTVNFAVTTGNGPAAAGATVQAVAPGPTGSVTVTVTGPVNSNSCTATVAVESCILPGTDFPQPGTYTLTATYAGDTNFNTSSGTASHQVNQAGPVGGAAIPTLQEWALILMGLLFGGLVWRQSRRTGRMEA